MGNLRTALLAWMFARSSGRTFRLRMEDLDRVATGSAQRQLADLAELGIEWDPPVMWQSERLFTYDNAISELQQQGRTYNCYCTRREVLEAPSAPHTPAGAYPGTCRTLTTAQERAHIDAGRRPAIRLRADVTEFTVSDVLNGRYTGTVDDFVLRRGDGVPAYNLAVVIDDNAQAVDQVVRGDDLLSSAPRQAYLSTVLGLVPPSYAHVPMVLNTEHRRLAKRDGAVTLSDLNASGMSTERVLSAIATSLNLADQGEVVSAELMLARFVPASLPTGPWILDPADLLRS